MQSMSGFPIKIKRAWARVMATLNLWKEIREESSRNVTHLILMLMKQSKESWFLLQEIFLWIFCGKLPKCDDKGNTFHQNSERIFRLPFVIQDMNYSVYHWINQSIIFKIIYGNNSCIQQKFLSPNNNFDCSIQNLTFSKFRRQRSSVKFGSQSFWFNKYNLLEMNYV